jgi:uncharacterized protein YbjT (DUF2867 family)
LDARPDTTFPFGLMHKEIEEYLERSGLAWTHLRPTGFMQEYLREAPSIAEPYLGRTGTRHRRADSMRLAIASQDVARPARRPFP